MSEAEGVDDARVADGAGRSWESVVAIAALVVSAVALIAVAAAAPRGFDLTDEGWYWLAARHPLAFVRSSTEFQYPLRDVLALAGWNVARARVIRLGLVAVGTSAFVVSVARFARLRLGVVTGRGTRLLLVAVVLVSPFASNWFPRSPSYNDLALVAVLIGVAAMLLATASPSRPWGVDVAGWAVAGIASWFLLMVKFSALGAIAAGAVAVVVVTWGSWTWARSLVAVGSAVVGVGVGALVWQVHDLSLTETLHGMRTGLDQTGGSIHSPTSIVTAAIVGAIPFVLMVGMAWVAIRRDRGMRRPVVAIALVAGLVLVWLVTIALGANHQRTEFAWLVPAGLVFGAFLSWPRLAGRWLELDAVRRRGWLAIMSLLAVLPLLYSFGTANPLVNGAVPATSVWLTLLVMAFAAAPMRPGDRFGGSYPALVVVASALAGLLATWVVPFGIESLTTASASVTARSPISDVRLDASQADAVDGATRAMDDAAGLGPRNLLTFFGYPGLAYATKSTTPGLVLEDEEVDRTKSVIDRACAQRRPLFVGATDELPRWVTSRIEAACGVDLPGALRPVTTIDTQGKRIEIHLVDR